MSTTTALFVQSWQRLWGALGAQGNGLACRDELLARHAESWRVYHTLQHLGECLTALASAMALAVRPAEVEAGLWFHDAVYALQRHDNEEQSAALARQALSAAGVAPEAVQRVAGLVLATRHLVATDERPTPDAQLLVDIDLAILGAAPARFAEYEQQIRQEYGFVPEAEFRTRRQAVLASFIARPRLYATDFFHQRLEQQARSNLTRSLSGGVSASS